MNLIMAATPCVAHKVIGLLLEGETKVQAIYYLHKEYGISIEDSMPIVRAIVAQLHAIDRLLAKENEMSWTTRAAQVVQREIDFQLALQPNASLPDWLEKLDIWISNRVWRGFEKDPMSTRV
jgi:hypothetical protein